MNYLNNRGVSYYTFLLFIIFVCIFTLFAKGNFIDKETLPKWYSFYIFSLICGWSFIFIVRKKLFIKIDCISILLFVFILYLLARSIIQYPIGISSGLRYLSFILFFLFFKLAGTKGYLNSKNIATTVVFSTTLQAILGLMQFCGFVENNSSFPVIGSFDNPAGFAASVVLGLPFCFILFDKNKWINIFLIFPILFIGIAIILSQSRAGILSMLAVMLIYLYHKFYLGFSHKRKMFSLLIVVLIFTSLLLFLFFVKKESAIGRLLIWKISACMFWDKPTLGWGESIFRSQYMLYQSDYFRENSNSEYCLLADNTIHPFNEFLLLIVEHGVIGFVLLLILLYATFRNWQAKNLVFYLMILSILIFSIFSYPLRYPFIWLMLAYSLSEISSQSLKKHIFYIVIYRWLRFAFLIFLLVLGYIIIKDISFEYRWNQIAKRSLLGQTRDMLPMYQSLYQRWNGNYLFLYNYGAELNYIKNYKQSIEIFNQCTHYWNDYDIQMLLADSYYNLGEFDKSEKHYLLASNMCPNRFLPLYLMMKIYEEKEESERVLYIAKKITEKEIKIPSSTVTKIKIEAERILIRKY